MPLSHEELTRPWTDADRAKYESIANRSANLAQARRRMQHAEDDIRRENEESPMPTPLPHPDMERRMDKLRYGPPPITPEGWDTLTEFRNAREGEADFGAPRINR